VDGNDVLAMYAATKDALDKARNGNGPTLIEANTYRRANHTTSDDASKYRSEEEVKAWEKKDPIDRFRIYLKIKGLWDEKLEKQVHKDAKEHVEKEVKDAEATPPPAIEVLFSHTYSDMPLKLKEQMEDLKADQREDD